MKKWKGILGAVVCALALTACGGGQQTADPGAEAVAERLSAGGSFDEDLEKMDGQVALKVYRIQPDAITESAVYTGTAAVVDEISVWEAKDAETGKTVEKAVRDRVAAQKESYASYRPEEVPKLDAAVIERRGNYVVLCVSKDSRRAESLLDEIFE